MSALSDALDHSQSKALAALFKAYTRRDDEPDDDFFRVAMHGVGLDDDIQISFLLHAWKIMRTFPEAVPAGTNGAKQPEQVVENRAWTSGKHRGVTLADTPEDYLRWAADNHPDPIGRAASQEELQRRAEGVPF